MSDLISHTEIVDAHCLNVSRHRPVVCRLLIPGNHIDSRDTINVDTSNPINWRRILDHHITQFNHELTSDPDMTCIATSKLTQPEIDRSYSTLTDRILYHANACLSKKRYKRHLNPYWNEELKSLNQEMKQLRAIWCREGRPRENDIHNDSCCIYKAAKARFKRLHRKHVAEYLLYINDLIKELESSRLGMCMYTVDLCSPTVADDMVLVYFFQIWFRPDVSLKLQLCYEMAI